MTPKIPNALVLNELERELKTRKYYYPKWIVMGRITEATANHRIAVMEQLIQEYKEKSPKVLQKQLFA